MVCTNNYQSKKHKIVEKKEMVDYTISALEFNILFGKIRYLIIGYFAWHFGNFNKSTNKSRISVRLITITKYSVGFLEIYSSMKQNIINTETQSCSVS